MGTSHKTLTSKGIGNTIKNKQQAIMFHQSLNVNQPSVTMGTSNIALASHGIRNTINVKQQALLNHQSHNETNPQHHGGESKNTNINLH